MLFLTVKCRYDEQGTFFKILLKTKEMSLEMPLYFQWKGQNLSINSASGQKKKKKMRSTSERFNLEHIALKAGILRNIWLLINNNILGLLSQALKNESNKGPNP